jgi:hypothetical protein
MQALTGRIRCSSRMDCRVKPGNDIAVVSRDSAAQQKKRGRTAKHLPRDIDLK